MENYIALLFLIVPGFISRKIYKQTHNIRDNLTQFEKTMYCLLNSSIIIIVMLFILDSFSYISTASKVQDITALFNDIKFILFYGFSVSLVSIFIGLSTYRALRIYNWIINKIRDADDSKIEISTTIFDNCFNRQTLFQKKHNINHLVEIYKNDKLIGRGELISSVEKYKEFQLKPCEESIETIIEAKGSKNLYSVIYIDGQTGLVIKEIDLEMLSNN